MTTSPKHFCVTNPCPFSIWGPTSWKTMEWCLYVKHWSTQAATYSSSYGRSGYDMLECQGFFSECCHPAKEMGQEKRRGSAEKNEAKCWLHLILPGRSSSALIFVCLKGLVITFGTCYSVERSLASAWLEMEFSVLLTRLARWTCEGALPLPEWRLRIFPNSKTWGS